MSVGTEGRYECKIPGTCQVLGGEQTVVVLVEFMKFLCWPFSKINYKISWYVLQDKLLVVLYTYIHVLVLKITVTL